MQPDETVSRSALEKPLHLLTEHDISQLTRDDCRCYLKQKGMRRPSWNKSQAIQQVISLKSLLETTSRPGSRPPHEGHSDSNAGEEWAPHLSRDAIEPNISAQNDSVSPRRTTESIGQMTIFYSGEVGVFEDISDDKARIIMQLAASPLGSPHALRPFSSQLSPPSMIFPRMLNEKGQFNKERSNKNLEDNPEAPTPKCRKASVQRYLQKRKGRFKPKKRGTLPSSSRLDVDLNLAVGHQIPSHHLNTSDSRSFAQPRPPQTSNQDQRRPK